MKIIFLSLFISTFAIASCVGEAQMFPTKIKKAEELEAGCRVHVESLNLNFNPLCPLDDSKAWFEGIYLERCPEVGALISGILVDDGTLIRLY